MEIVDVLNNIENFYKSNLEDISSVAKKLSLETKQKTYDALQNLKANSVDGECFYYSSGGLDAEGGDGGDDGSGDGAMIDPEMMLNEYFSDVESIKQEFILNIDESIKNDVVDNISYRKSLNEDFMLKVNVVEGFSSDVDYDKIIDARFGIIKNNSNVFVEKSYVTDIVNLFMGKNIDNDCSVFFGDELTDNIKCILNNIDYTKYYDSKTDKKYVKKYPSFVKFFDYFLSISNFDYFNDIIDDLKKELSKDDLNKLVKFLYVINGYVFSYQSAVFLMLIGSISLNKIDEYISEMIKAYYKVVAYSKLNDNRKEKLKENVDGVYKEMYSVFDENFGGISDTMKALDKAMQYFVDNGGYIEKLTFIANDVKIMK